MAAHRYWRLNAAAISGTVMRIGDMQLRTAINGANVAVGGTASASAVGSGHTASLAFDGSGATAWWAAAASTAEWLAYDFGLGNEKDIVEMALTVDGAAYSSMVRAGALEWSDNGSAWTPLFAFYEQIWSGNETKVFTYRDPGQVPVNLKAVWGYNDFRYAVYPVTRRLSATARVGPSPIDAVDGGAYRISSTVKTKGTPDAPVMRRVFLFDHDSFRVIRSQWSDPITGAYSFDKIRMGKFFVVAFDHLHDYRAVIADNLTPEPMP
jgi:hypothetical protein